METASLPCVGVSRLEKVKNSRRGSEQPCAVLTGSFCQTKRAFNQLYSLIQTVSFLTRHKTFELTESHFCHPLSSSSVQYTWVKLRAGNLLPADSEIQQEPGVVINSLPGLQSNKPNTGSETAKKTQREICLRAALTQQKLQN